MHGSILHNEESPQIPNGKNPNASNNDTEKHVSNSIQSQHYVVTIRTSDTQFFIPAMSLTSYIILSHVASWNFSFLMCKMGLIMSIGNE